MNYFFIIILYILKSVMKLYQIYFFTLKIIILIMLILGSLKIIPKNTKFFIIVELLFKISLSIFLIFYIGSHKRDQLDKDDRLIIMGSGIVILLLINYKKILKKYFIINLE